MPSENASLGNKISNFFSRLNNGRPRNRAASTSSGSSQSGSDETVNSNSSNPLPPRRSEDRCFPPLRTRKFSGSPRRPKSLNIEQSLPLSPDSTTTNNSGEASIHKANQSENLLLEQVTEETTSSPVIPDLPGSPHFVTEAVVQVPSPSSNDPVLMYESVSPEPSGESRSTSNLIENESDRAESDASLPGDYLPPHMLLSMFESILSRAQSASPHRTASMRSLSSIPPPPADIPDSPSGERRTLRRNITLRLRIPTVSGSDNNNDTQSAQSTDEQLLQQLQRSGELISRGLSRTGTPTQMFTDTQSSVSVAGLANNAAVGTQNQTSSTTDRVQSTADTTNPALTDETGSVVEMEQNSELGNLERSQDSNTSDVPLNTENAESNEQNPGGVNEFFDALNALTIGLLARVIGESMRAGGPEQSNSGQEGRESDDPQPNTDGNTETPTNNTNESETNATEDPNPDQQNTSGALGLENMPRDRVRAFTTGGGPNGESPFFFVVFIPPNTMIVMTMRGGPNQSLQGQPPASQQAVSELLIVDPSTCTDEKCLICQEEFVQQPASSNTTIAEPTIEIFETVTEDIEVDGTESSSQQIPPTTTPAENGAIEVVEISATESTEASQKAVFPNEQQILAMPCNPKHIFHADELKEWLKNSNTCPVCRYELLTDNEEYNELVRRRNAARTSSRAEE